MAEFEYRFVTCGEHLYRFLRLWLADTMPRHELAEWLGRAGRAEEWMEYLEQLSAVALTGRIVAAGRSLEAKHSADPKLYAREFRSYLNDHLLISKDHLDKLMRLALQAVEVADGKIPKGAASDARGWAQHNHRHCYLCGDPLDFTPGATNDKIYTCEHIWPSSYGGDSVAENFLPACQKCNSQKKRHFATWAMVSVQSVIRGINPTEIDLDVIDGTPRFALHYLAGQRYAINHGTSLKRAFLRIGPWTTLRVNDINDVAHFFNLSIHSADVDID